MSWGITRRKTLGASLLTKMSISKPMAVFPMMLCFLFSIVSALPNPNAMACNERQKNALLTFKQALYDPAHRLSSWSIQHHQDCCQWAGVHCHNITGRVLKLDLHNPCWDSSAISCDEFKLGGKVSPALLQSEFLNDLDLSYNDFGGIPIPSFLGSMRSLIHLNLSYASFGGLIPSELGNLSNLHSLHLGGDYSFSDEPPPLYVRNLKWISRLSSLEDLLMYGVDLRSAVDWLESINMLSSLSELALEYCNLDNMNPSLQSVNFTSLTSLVLLGNHFNHDEMPNWVFKLPYLQELYLLENGLRGQIPEYEGQLKHLEYLALEYNSLDGPIPSSIGNLSPPLYVRNLKWISRLSSLEDLLMYGIDLRSAVDWLESINMLSSLSELALEYCNLDNMNPSLQSVNFTSLTVLCLFGNHFNHEMPHWVFKLPDLHWLQLSENGLRGQIPEYVGQLKHLEYLLLEYNSLDGPIPSSIGNLSSLRYLWFNGNRLNETLPSSLWLLSNLEILGIGNNSFEGRISEVHFNKLSKLRTLGMAHSPYLVFEIDPNWVPPFQLHYLRMGSCHMGPTFPTWLQTQTSLQYLDISDSGIVDSTPAWFWNWASHLEQLFLYNNKISGNLSGVLLNNTYIDLSSNCFKGALPRLSSNVVIFNMANNSFSGSISHFLCQKLNGESKLTILDMSTNRLTGEIPDCLKDWQSLTRLNLGNNYLSGKIPDSMASLFKFEALHLNNNRLFGNIPPSLSNCTSLGLLDLGGNKFSGSIPSWLGERTTLVVLKLGSNGFMGNIPLQICQLSFLIVLDFSKNNLSGTIPKCFNNFTLMTATGTKYDDVIISAIVEYSYYVHVYENIMLVIKGRESEYKSILKLVRNIDLSSNNLSGSIPDEISSLSTLHFLNLSFNHLMGRIPEKIGNMKSLESLDLSRNHLSSEIPQSMTDLTLLNHFNLSYNNLSGRIPSSTQLQSFDASSYVGNVELCGAPPTNNCTRDEEPEGMNTIDKIEERSKIQWFYVGMVFGFIVGFWGVCGSLILKRSWRHAYFQFVYHVMGWVYIAIVMKWKWLQNVIKRET